MVLFQVPAGHQNSGIEMGMILTCWRGVKAPKIFSGPVNVNACVAFRAVALEVSSEDRLIIEWGWMGQVDHFQSFFVTSKACRTTRFGVAAPPAPPGLCALSH